MERRVRYEVLHNEEDPPGDELPPSSVSPQPDGDVSGAGPPHDQDMWHEEEGKVGDVLAPPSYTVATSLPTYEEAERTKEEEAQRASEQPLNTPSGVRDVDRFADMQLGTDGMFLCMFILAFLFNWIGLLASLCITHTVAGRFGAIAGFGLSMVKWAAIVKVNIQGAMVAQVANHTDLLAARNHSVVATHMHNNWAGGIADGDSWLWWLLIVLGFLIFFRGCTQYIRLKYQWHRLSTNLRSRVYLLF